MKNFKIDIYKLLLLIVASFFTYCYLENSKIGRFVPLGYSIIDTKNGAVYYVSGGHTAILHSKPILK